MNEQTNLRGARLLILLVVIFAFPGAVIALGTIGLTAAGVDSHKALSMSGLVTVGIAAVWGPIVAFGKLDDRLSRRTRTTSTEG